MNTHQVTTNLRIPHQDWQRLKTVASEFEMSTNEYIKQIIKENINKVGLADFRAGQRKKKTIFEALRELASKKYKRKPMGLSEEDETIYEDP